VDGRVVFKGSEIDGLTGELNLQFKECESNKKDKDGE
jgi:hypothetical protein